MVWLGVDDACYVAVDTKDVGAVLRHESQQRPIAGNVRTCDWRFDFRRRDKFKPQRCVSILEGKAENLCARLIEYLRDDIAVVFPDEEALAVERGLGKLEVPGVFREDISSAGLRIRLVDFINGQRVPLAFVVPDVANVEMPSVFDRAVFPIVQRHVDNGEDYAR